MSDLINKATQAELRELFLSLDKPVEIVHFTQTRTPVCSSCLSQQQLLETVVSLSDKLTLTVYDFVNDDDKAWEYAITRVPATVVIGEQGHGIRFFGVTGGYEFTSLVDDIMMLSSGEHGLSAEEIAMVSLINRPVHLEVLVTLTCPYCPKMVRVIHQLAMANPLIRGDMVDSSEFPQLVQRYRVGGVPYTVIDEGVGFDGALSVTQTITEILKHVDPSAYQRFEEQIREFKGERKVSGADPERLYDVLIVGIGPAAMTATIFAARKTRDVLVLGKDIGGQMVDMASIENWPGSPDVSGDDLATEFRNHAERYPVAERLGVEVTAIEKPDEYFRVTTDDGTSYQARSVIYSAGKRYRQLGVPGEKRFLGRGISFCSTCDAPLFRDKRVAVVGGANSALAAARDLLSYASEIHIINMTPDFQADSALVEQLTDREKVTLHPSTHVRGFLGDEQLTGIRLESAIGDEREDLAVEGVFLEIGLEPNTEPVAGLLSLNHAGEIPVQCNQASEIAGLYAAGDCTDQVEKQIVIVAGAGAKAALAADEYLG